MARIALLLLTFLVPATAHAFTIELPAIPHPGISGDALFDRIDSLQVLQARATGADRADLATRLGILHLATGLSSHQSTAQDWFSEAMALDPARAEPWYWSAIALQQSGYFTLARQKMGELLAREPDVLEHLLVLARLEFVEARLRNHKHDFDASYQLHLRALGLDPLNTNALIGGGSTALLVGNYQLARDCAAKLRKSHPEMVEGWYLHAAADQRLGNVESAWVDFLRAISLAPKPERDVFLGGSILVRDEELASIARTTVAPDRAMRVRGAQSADGSIDWVEVVTDPRIRAEVLERWWMKRDPSPSAFENEGELEYWARLVESDLLFGRPDIGLRGWETLPGEVWVRLGKPLSRHHWLPETELDSQFQEAGVPQTTQDRGYRSLALAPPSVFWDWGYVIDGRPVMMRFVDESYGQPKWSVGPGSTVDVGVLRTEMPFVEPERHRPRGLIELHASIACFPRGAQALLETSISAYCPQFEDLASPALDSVLVEWTLMNKDQEVLDQELRTLGQDHRLSSLLFRAKQASEPELRDPFVGVIGARLDAGEYLIRVKVINPRGGVFTSKTFGVDVPSSAAGGPLALSSIQLAHGIPQWDTGTTLPMEFVKHGRVVVSAADAVIEGDELGVFYEIANAGRDETGQTSFDVEYAIYAATGQVRLFSMLGSFDPAQLEEVELSTVQFLHERTGVSPEGFVVKGTGIDISALREGDYVIRIQVDDRVTGDSVSAVVPFRRPAGPRTVSDAAH